jgi:hypothetical protein
VREEFGGSADLSVLPLQLVLQRIQVLRDFSGNQLLFQAYCCLYLLFHLVCDSFECFIHVLDGVEY